MKVDDSFKCGIIAVENFVMTPLVFVLIIAKHLVLAVVGVWREIAEGEELVRGSDR